MSYTNLTPQEWAEISASALAEKNREVVSEMISRFEKMQEKAALGERENWRRVFASSAIQSGFNCENAISIADRMLNLLGID